MMPTENKCIYCGAVLRDKYNRAATKWDWFTAQNTDTQHCCPQCLHRHASDWGELKLKAGVNDANRA